MEQLAAVEFQYNDKRHVTIGRTPFELNFGRYLWKGNLVVQSEIPRVEELETSYKDNGRSTEEHEKTIQQEKAKSSRTEGQRQCVAREQKYSIELTLKEVGQ